MGSQSSATASPRGPQPPGLPPPSPGRPTGHRPRILLEFDRFWQRVTDGLELSQLMSQFKQDAQIGFRFYQKDFDAGASPDQRRGRRFLKNLQALAWAILEKLSPARRVLLLLAVIFLLLPGGGLDYHSGGRNIEITVPSLQLWGGIILLVLLMLEVADRVVMKRDLEIARDIQNWLLPAKPPTVPGLSIAFATRPANTVAGDFYDIFARQNATQGEGVFLLAVADVAGKSIPAALLMATFQASLKTLSSTPCSLAELVDAMNRYACGNSQGGLRFTTAFLGEYDPASRSMSYINAGHNNPLLRRASGAVERLSLGGLPLGIRQEAAYETGAATLRDGDWLIIFTDGLVEAQNQFSEEYGEQRLLAVLEAGKSTTPDQMLQRVIAEVNHFVGTTPQHDDITCMLIKAGSL